MGVSAKIDEFLWEVHDSPYETNPLSMLQAYFDSCEPLGFCQGSRDTSSFFCSELVAEALQRTSVLSDDIPSSEIVPMDFLQSNGEQIERAKLRDGVRLGPPL